MSISTFSSWASMGVVNAIARMAKNRFLMCAVLVLDVECTDFLAGKELKMQEIHNILLLTSYVSRLTSELEIVCHRRNDREQRYLLGFNFQRSIIRISGLIEVYKIRIQVTINIINAEYPIMLPFPWM